jgi:signal peptidase I
MIPQIPLALRGYTIIGTVIFSGCASACPWLDIVRALIRELIETVILALLIFLALQFSVQNFRVEGPSMNLTLEDGQHLLVNKIVYMSFDSDVLKRFLAFFDADGEEDAYTFHRPRRGEVIIFEYPRDESRDFVKRIIGVPGDTVEIRNGATIVNGDVIDEPYITNADNDSMIPLELLPGEYFVMGDNRRFSNDSRDWGPVPEQNIIGRAWFSYWPLGAWHTLQAFSW